MTTDTLFTISAFDKKAPAHSNRQKQLVRNRRRESKPANNLQRSSFETMLRQEFKARQVDKSAVEQSKTLRALKRYWG